MNNQQLFAIRMFRLPTITSYFAIIRSQQQWLGRRPDNRIWFVAPGIRFGKYIKCFPGGPTGTKCIDEIDFRPVVINGQFLRCGQFSWRHEGIYLGTKVIGGIKSNQKLFIAILTIT